MNLTGQEERVELGVGPLDRKLITHTGQPVVSIVLCHFSSHVELLMLLTSCRMDHLHYRLNFDLDKNFITA
jgi:hypothetical protein